MSGSAAPGNDLLDATRPMVANVGPDYQRARELQDQGYSEARGANGALVAALRGMTFDDASILRAKIAAGLMAPTRSGSSAEGWSSAANAYADTKSAQQNAAFDRAIKIATIQEAGAKLLQEQAQAKLGMVGTGLGMPGAMLGAGQGMAGLGIVGTMPGTSLSPPGGAASGASAQGPAPGLPPGSRPMSAGALPPGNPGLPPPAPPVAPGAQMPRTAGVQSDATPQPQPASAPGGGGGAGGGGPPVSAPVTPDDPTSGRTPDFTTKAAQQAWVRFQQRAADPRAATIPIMSQMQKADEEVFTKDPGYAAFAGATKLAEEKRQTGPIEARTKALEETNTDERKQLDDYKKASQEAQAAIDAANKVDAARENLMFPKAGTGPLAHRVTDLVDPGAGLVKEAVGVMRQHVIAAQNKGAISNMEQKIYAAQVPGTEMNDASAKLVTEGARLAAQRVQEQEKFMRNYYRTNGTLQGAVEQWNNFAKARPIFGTNDKTKSFELYKGNVGGWESYVQAPKWQRPRAPTDTQPDGYKIPSRLPGVQEAGGGKMGGAQAAPAAGGADPALVAAARAELARRLAAQPQQPQQ